MKKILFLIHDLRGGGAEKVLINLVNHMDYSKFDITVLSLFDVGENKQYLRKEINYKCIYKKVFRGNQHYLKLFTPSYLHEKFIKDTYDIEIAYLEGPCARIISGCKDNKTKLIAWIHCTMKSKKQLCEPFRSFTEASTCYERFDNTVFVSLDTKLAFTNYCNVNQNNCVLYNTNDTKQIILESQDPIEEPTNCDAFMLVGTGKLEKIKGFERLIRIHKRLLSNGYNVKTIILGKGSEEDNLKSLIRDLGVNDSVKLMGYQSNPHKYVSKCNLFVCSSFSEGFSTAATEALIVGTPVCTVEVSGMRELLGFNNEYGVVTQNSENDLYDGIKALIDNPELYTHYKKQAIIRGKDFSTTKTVKAVEDMLMNT